MTQSSNIKATNEMAIFIFLVPQGTVGQELFISPVYQSLRQVIARRCHCELAVFDGNTLVQRCMSSPNSVSLRPRFGYCNSNLAPFSCGDEESTNLLLAISNSYEQLLLARGNWLVQVHYQTEPSCHHLFTRLVANYGTQLSDSGLKRAGLSKPVNQGFKYTTLAAITHEKLRALISHQNYTTKHQVAKLPIEKENFNYVCHRHGLIRKSSRNSTTQTKSMPDKQPPAYQLQNCDSGIYRDIYEEVPESETETKTSLENVTKIPLRNNESSGMVYHENYLDTLRLQLRNTKCRKPRIYMASPPIRICENSEDETEDVLEANREVMFPLSPYHCDTVVSESSIHLPSALNAVASVTCEQ